MLLRQKREDAESEYSKKTAVKYPKPSVIVIDADTKIVDCLQKAGYNVEKGSFGKPLQVPPDDTLRQLPLSTADLPYNLSEKEIFIINTLDPSPSAGEKDIDAVGKGVETFWQTCSEGIIDPRRVWMSHSIEDLIKARNSGAIFVIFVGDNRIFKYIYGRAGPRGGGYG